MAKVSIWTHKRIKTTTRANAIKRDFEELHVRTCSNLYSLNLPIILLYLNQKEPEMWVKKQKSRNHFPIRQTYFQLLVFEFSHAKETIKQLKTKLTEKVNHGSPNIVQDLTTQPDQNCTGSGEIVQVRIKGVWQQIQATTMPSRAPPRTCDGVWPRSSLSFLLLMGCPWNKSATIILRTCIASVTKLVAKVRPQASYDRSLWERKSSPYMQVSVKSLVRQEHPGGKLKWANWNCQSKGIKNCNIVLPKPR